jgi:murein DD-endopeptidase MepM/ murein hydrolase activator NlpD
LRYALLAVLAFLFAAGPAAALDLDGPVEQGALRVGTVAPGATVTVDGKDVRVDPTSGRFVFGIDRDRTEPVRIVVSGAETAEFSVAARTYDTERIDGLPPRKVTPNALDMERVRREGAQINAARGRDTALADLFAGFRWPVTGRISGRYGNQRILNGEPRRPHLGVDIAAPMGTLVSASAAGEVSLAEPDLFYTGGTVVIDHGHGVSSIYSHLSRVNVAVGQRVAAGEAIGAVGSTGRSTGPHLDWRINWFQLRLDPERIAGPMPK